MSKHVNAWALAVTFAAVLAPASAAAAADDEGTIAIVTAGQAGLYRKAGGRIASKVLIEGETVYVMSTTPTDGYFNVKLSDEKTAGWMKVQDLRILIDTSASDNSVKSQ